MYQATLNKGLGQKLASQLRLDIKPKMNLLIILIYIYLYIKYPYLNCLYFNNNYFNC